MTITKIDQPILETGWIYGQLDVGAIIAQGKTTEAIVLLDFEKIRADRWQKAQSLVITQAVVQLTQHPLTRITIPEVSLPDFPTFEIPEISLPSAETIGVIVDGTGKLALSFSVALMLLIVGPIAILESQSLVSKAFPQNTPTETTAPERPETVTVVENITNPKDIFSLSIPELEIESTITANVNASSKKSYEEALKSGIAHAAGSGLPDQFEVNQTMYLFAHSTDETWNIARYNAQFYALKDAKPGQVITVRFWGKDYTYKIEEKHIIAANDTSWLEPQFEKKQLVLQTCYPPGTAWKRLVVVATPLEENRDL